jgi:hypothetical protein
VAAAGPEIAKRRQAGAHREPYRRYWCGRLQHMKLSEARATSVRKWLAARSIVPQATPIKGYGQDQADRAQPVQRRARRSGGPAEEPARRGRTPARERLAAAHMFGPAVAKRAP